MRTPAISTRIDGWPAVAMLYLTVYEAIADKWSKG